ncbi:serine hydrolase domain-containing protein [Enterococcus sp. BWR-S5]|uniref:serine hydrolase domain-containing protein n=1 Tax=Enterococcus sp. BWR-S5 TaxID=2787714 RepID=UPI0019219634|nr:serine hydrolase domain-containing protein [Enterococcus sp. BWR-S5]MBL1226483.1 beta-lactamase family protein [Enterococcus sp. BWR-S5]
MNQELISNKINHLIQRKIISGASWSFISEGKSENYYAGVMGAYSPFSEMKIKERLFYDLASLTKVIGTTTRILQLIDDGTLNFTTNVNKIIPDFSHLEITIGDLLLHRGGFPADFLTKEKELLTPDFLYTYFRNYPVREAASTVYSDIGFLLLGLIIQAVDNCSLEQSFQKNIFRPLGMRDTSYFLLNPERALPTEQTLERGTIQGTVHDSKAYKMNTEIGSAGLFSTLEDINLFVSAYLANDDRLFHQALFAKVKSTEVAGRTYGWEQKRGCNGPYLFHTGFTGTSIGMNLEEKIGFVLLTNRIHPSRDEKGFIKARAALYTNYF